MHVHVVIHKHIIGFHYIHNNIFNQQHSPNYKRLVCFHNKPTSNNDDACAKGGILWCKIEEQNLCVDDVIGDLFLCDGNVLQYHLQPHGHHTS